MRKIRTVIVDDERLARQRLRRLLTQHEQVEIIAEAADGVEALDKVKEHQPDLLLLDIHMPGMDGLEVAEALPAGRLPIVVFATAFDEHALRAFDACAIDYLLKPVAPARLEKTLARVEQHLAAFAGKAPESNAAPDPVSLRRFHVRTGQRTRFIAPSEIDWIEADGNYAVLHVGLEGHLLRSTMTALETELPSNFIRISRSGIVNLRRVKEVRAAGHGHFAVMENNDEVPVTCSVRELNEQLRSL